jgi:hypothetical protein
VGSIPASRTKKTRPVTEKLQAFFLSRICQARWCFGHFARTSMNKAFTKESDADGDDDDLQLPPIPVAGQELHHAPGFARLRSEWLDLMDNERPKMVEAGFGPPATGIVLKTVTTCTARSGCAR